MERLTVKSPTMNRYTLKRMCGFDREGEPIVEEDCYEHCEQMLDSGYCSDCAIKEAFERLAAYEDTGLTPEEVEAVLKDYARLHQLLDDLEAVLTSKPPEHNSGNDDKVHCKDCDYLNMDSGKPHCCHSRMSTNGLDDWCNFGIKRQVGR